MSTTVTFMPLFSYKNVTTNFAGLTTNTYEATNRSTTYSGFCRDLRPRRHIRSHSRTDGHGYTPNNYF